MSQQRDSDADDRTDPWAGVETGSRAGATDLDLPTPGEDRHTD